MSDRDRDNQADHAQTAMEKASTLTDALTQAVSLLTNAGPEPNRPSPQWADQVAKARQAMEPAITLLDSRGHDQSPMAQAVFDLQRHVEQLRANHLDTHRDHYYRLWEVSKHHFLLDTSAAQHPLAFDDPDEAEDWVRYHKPGRLQPFDPRTVPTTGLDPVRTVHILQAIDAKDWLKNRTTDIRAHLQMQDDKDLQQLRNSIDSLSPRLRRRLSDLTGI